MLLKELKPLELEALRIVDRAKGAYGWYQVARVLPVFQHPDEDQNVVRILKRLVNLGLIASDGSSIENLAKFHLTDEGRVLLNDSPANTSENAPAGPEPPAKTGSES